MAKISKRTIHLHIDEDRLYFAMLRLKASMECKTWKEFMYKICNLPIQPQLNTEDQARCEQLYQVMGKARSYNISPDSELVRKCQNKAQDIINEKQQHQKALDELIEKRKQLLELIDDPELSPSRHEQCVEMLLVTDKVIAQSDLSK